jgi:DNA-binding response OmpR family regulator
MASTHKKQPQRILVCDDDQDLAYLLRTVLQDAGYSASSASTTAELEGVLADATRRPDLILLDVKLGDQDATASLERAQRIGLAVPPVVLISARVALGDLVRTTGAAAGIAKPFAIKDLLSTVQQTLASS